MEEDVISKKELLELTGISYGQLYRWKRKNLIPEDWFIRRSTFTGQETFFPRRKMLARLDRIIHMKDDLSLDELADVFSPSPGDLLLTREDLLARNIVAGQTLDFYTELTGDGAAFPFERLLALYILDALLRSGDINREEGRMLVQVLGDHGSKLAEPGAELLLLRKMGISGFLLITQPEGLYWDEGFRLVTRVRLGEKREELKIKLG